MQNPLSEYRSGLFATHDNLDESFSYLNSMISTMSSSDQQGINVAVRCLINTLADEIDKVYHPSKNMSIGSLVDKYLDDVLAVRVEEIVNERISSAIDQYMADEFDITDYDSEIDWEDRISSNLDKDVLREIVEETIKDNITFEVRVS
jgi:hypothetical protein